MLFRSLFLSLLIHLAVIFSLSFNKSIIIPKISKPLEITIIPKPKEKKLIIQKITNQESPDESDYYSSHNQKVKKQQSSKKHLTLKDLMPKINPQQLGTNNSLKSTPPQDFNPNGDKIDNLPEGEETLINSKEFVYYSFFTRIRQRLESVWHPSVRKRIEKLIKNGRHVLYTSRTTKLLITLNSSGSLTKVQIINNSGVEDLDQEAVEAFKIAEPFPNPPQGLIKPDGTITITWDFIVEN